MSGEILNGTHTQKEKRRKRNTMEIEIEEIDRFLCILCRFFPHSNYTHISFFFALLRRAEKTYKYFLFDQSFSFKRCPGKSKKHA